MMVAKSRPEIDIKEAIGQHEFSVIPRSLFANDGTMFYCSMKSALMSIRFVKEPSISKVIRKKPKLILHALDATANGATTLEIHSPDRDVFELSLRRYPELCRNTYFVTGTGQRRRRISLKSNFPVSWCG